MSEEKIVSTESAPIEEPVKLSKEEMFANNPDEFVHLSEIVCAIFKNEKQYRVMISTPDRLEIGHAIFLLSRQANKMLDVLEFKHAQEKQLAQQVAQEHGKKGFRNFIRSGK